jgi:hypothetical protein
MTPAKQTTACERTCHTQHGDMIPRFSLLPNSATYTQQQR